MLLAIQGAHEPNSEVFALPNHLIIESVDPLLAWGNAGSGGVKNSTFLCIGRVSLYQLNTVLHRSFTLEFEKEASFFLVWVLWFFFHYLGLDLNWLRRDIFLSRLWELFSDFLKKLLVGGFERSFGPNHLEISIPISFLLDLDFPSNNHLLELTFAK